MCDCRNCHHDNCDKNTQLSLNKTIELTPHEILTVRMALASMDIDGKLIMTNKVLKSRNNILNKLKE